MDWKSRSLLPRLLYIVQCRNRYRPPNNDTEWWRSYVGEFFAPNGVVRVSVKDMPLFQAGNSNAPQSLTCTEVPFEVLPRLFQYKYENGVQEELLFLGNVIESPLPGGGTSIICYQAAEHLVFDGYSLIQYGHLKVVFNSSLKVQLLDFSVTGYDLHLDHSVVCGELRQLNQVLEGRSQQLSQQAATNNVDPKALQDSLRETSNFIKLVHNRLDQYLSYEWAYIQKTLHFMQIADVISNMHELFHVCKDERTTPIRAFQKFGKLSARVPPWPKEYEQPPDNSMGMGPSGPSQQQQQQGLPGLTNNSPSLSPGHASLNSLLAAKQQQMADALNRMSPAIGPDGLPQHQQQHKHPSPSLLGVGGLSELQSTMSGGLQGSLQGGLPGGLQGGLQAGLQGGSMQGGLGRSSLQQQLMGLQQQGGGQQGLQGLMQRQSFLKPDPGGMSGPGGLGGHGPSQLQPPQQRMSAQLAMLQQMRQNQSMQQQNNPMQNNALQNLLGMQQGPPDMGHGPLGGS